MKKLAIVASLLALSTSAFASTTGTLLLRGSVTKVLSISVAAETIAQTLDLSTNKSDLKVATVNEKSNSKTGYTVSISSANLGKLKRTDGSEVFSYSMKYAGQGVNLGAEHQISNAAGVANINKDVTISYSGISQDLMVEGTYEDTVTFTIASN